MGTTAEDSPNPAEKAGPDISQFAERLLAVIDDGRRTATYKLALIMALTACCIEGGGWPSRSLLSLSTRKVAKHVADQYWRQMRPFPSANGAVDLRQITNKSAAILAALSSLQNEVPSASSWDAAEKESPKWAANVLDKIELTVARYPLLRLQVVDGVHQPFIYDTSWSEGVTLGYLHHLGDDAVRFRPGATDQLVRLSPLVRPLVESHWVRMVAELNNLAPVEDDLRRHLFGAERAAFPRALRNGLGELQAHDCFYCGAALGNAGSAIDHFIPWARWPNEAIENLVVAHSSCNGHKSDRIPGPIPLTRWTYRLQAHRKELVNLAIDAKWSSASDRTISVTTSLYGHIPKGAPLWNGPGEVIDADPVQILDILNPIMHT